MCHVVFRNVRCIEVHILEHHGLLLEAHQWLLPVLLVLESCYSQDKQPGGLDMAQPSARQPREDTHAIQSKRLSVDT